MKNIHVLIKPASEKCNMDCDYCFYHDIGKNRAVKDFGMMNKQTTECLIQRIFADRELINVTIGFQGGEPLLAGLNYYDYFLKTVAKYNHQNAKVSYNLQTNGTLLTEEYGQFFFDNNFLIGISIDGPGKLHDSYRVLNNRGNSHSLVIRGLNILKKFNVEYNVLLVVTNSNAKFAEKIYNYMKKLEITHLQFIPCIDPIGVANGKMKWSLTPSNYTIFLNKLFKLWYQDLKTNSGFSIQYFDNIYGVINNVPPSSCFLRGVCTLQNIVEADGSVYICDFYVNENYQIGHIKDSNFSEMAMNPQIDDFIQRSKTINQKCQQCQYLGLCRNGCYRYRNPLSNQNIYCTSFKEFFQRNYKEIISLKLLK